jgi:hypothetical protein
LIQLLHEDEERFYRLLCLSYRYLPMPRMRRLQSTQKTSGLFATSSKYASLLGPMVVPFY